MSYEIGTPGEPWTDVEIAQWRSLVHFHRSYQDLVVDRIYALSARCNVLNYGCLPCDPLRYPVFALEIPSCNASAPWVLITGGVHGYETSGVLGAIEFVERRAQDYQEYFNILVLPCISPWGFESINRWNVNAVDPNRSFTNGGECEEARAVIAFLTGLEREFVMHIDLHETTDTDATEFRPALAAKLGKEDIPIEIPDGFYLVGDKANPQDAFQAAIISAVEEVTHIAPNDEQGRLLGDVAAQRGVVNYDYKPLGLCAGVTDAPYTTTTEVYPDSPTASPEQCIEAQIMAVCAGLDYVLSVS